MKQVAQNYKSGELTVLDVAGPGVQPGRRPGAVAVLADLHRHRDDEGDRGQAVAWSARRGPGPDQVRKVLDTVAQQGAVATYKKVMNKLDSYTPLGYSLCGVVVEVGAGAEEFKVGQLVAAAGNEFALHAEYNWVPVNLCVRGAAAACRPSTPRSPPSAPSPCRGCAGPRPQLGETALVIGLGLVGQLVVRLLVAAGVRVVGLDMIEDRCRLAEKAGAVRLRGPGRRRPGRRGRPRWPS